LDAYVSALSALAGAAIGSLASFSTSWVTQRTQIRHTQSEAERARLEALYSDFITESARLLGDALSHQKDDIADMVGLYALVGRMRLVSSPAVVAAADQIISMQIHAAPVAMRRSACSPTDIFSIAH